jgi:hypothetical protein
LAKAALMHEQLMQVLVCDAGIRPLEAVESRFNPSTIARMQGHARRGTNDSDEARDVNFACAPSGVGGYLIFPPIFTAAPRSNARPSSSPMPTKS